MSRLSVEHLSLPPKRFRPDQNSDAAGVKIAFETKAKAKAEDAIRRRSIRRLLKRTYRIHSPVSEKRLRRLRRRIKRSASPASSRYMRKHRIRIAGHLWLLIADHPELASAFTLIPRSWEVKGGHLHDADPTVFLEQLRQALIREGASTGGGWLFASIHGEHEPNEDIFRLHVHGIAVGAMRTAVDRLRKRANFRSNRKGDQADKVRQRVRMTRKPLCDLPEPLTYTVQSFWPERAIFRNDEGDWERQKKKRRIEEPRHSEVLHWLDLWSARQTCLLMGIRVTPRGLCVSTDPYSKGVRP